MYQAAIFMSKSSSLQCIPFFLVQSLSNVSWFELVKEQRNDPHNLST